MKNQMQLKSHYPNFFLNITQLSIWKKVWKILKHTQGKNILVRNILMNIMLKLFKIMKNFQNQIIIPKKSLNKRLDNEMSHSMIKYTGDKKIKQGVSIYYTHLKSQNLATAKTYILAMKAFASCDQPDAVWDIYAKDVSSSLKVNSWEVHRIIMQ